MDPLTHGLLGLSLGNLRRPDGERPAVLTACVLAAELPDLDYLWPASDPVLHALQAHRGLSHSLLAVPVVALVAAGLAKLVFRRARLGALYVWSAGSALFAHLLADAWTGWGTRLLLPFSDARVTLDWMMVVDPFFTLPLVVGALWGIRRRRLGRRALLAGLALASGYLVTRIGVQSAIEARVRASYPDAEHVQVFPSWLGPVDWRYVASFPERYRIGRVRVGSAPVEQAEHPRSNKRTLSAAARTNATVQEALAWARFGVVGERPTSGGTEVHVADLRYHLGGEPTLRFVIGLDERGAVTQARLDRGGSALSLLDRFRRPRTRLDPTGDPE